MNKLTKKTLLIIAIITLIIINISALATIFYNNKVKKVNSKEFHNQQEQIRRSGMNSYLKGSLNLSDEQFILFRKINQEYAGLTRIKGRELQENRHILLHEVSSPNPDQYKIDSIARVIGDLHYNLKIITSEHFMELKAICNPEQQEKLQRLFFRMISDQDGEREKSTRKDKRNRHRRNNRNKRK